MNFLKKINPLDYKNNPIGALKTETMILLVLIVSLSYMSGASLVFEMIYKESPSFKVNFWVVILLTFFVWGRIAYLISYYLKEKELKEGN